MVSGLGRVTSCVQPTTTLIAVGFGLCDWSSEMPGGLDSHGSRPARAIEAASLTQVFSLDLSGFSSAFRSPN